MRERAVGGLARCQEVRERRQMWRKKSGHAGLK